jgi:hypothetical protein
MIKKRARDISPQHVLHVWLQPPQSKVNYGNYGYEPLSTCHYGMSWDHLNI